LAGIKRHSLLEIGIDLEKRANTPELNQRSALQERLRALIDWIAEDAEAIRPGRRFPRRSPGLKKPGFHPAYKRSA
jgi:hypothetical protein